MNFKEKGYYRNKPPRPRGGGRGELLKSLWQWDWENEPEFGRSPSSMLSDCTIWVALIIHVLFSKVLLLGVPCYY